MAGPKQLGVVIAVSLTALVARTRAFRDEGGLGSAGLAESEVQGQSSAGAASSFAPHMHRGRVHKPVRSIAALRAQHVPQNRTILVSPNEWPSDLHVPPATGAASQATFQETVPVDTVPVEGSSLGFPKKLLGTFKNPKFLNTGGFGEVWSVTHRGKPRVVKVLHYNEEQFLTWELASQEGFEQSYQSLLGAAKECETTRNIRHGGRLFDGGSKYIMDCYSHNIREPNALTRLLPSMRDPLYLVMEHCGEEDLWDFRLRHVEEGTWTPELVMEIYVQLLEALAYLGRHPKKWVHHDLKTPNIVINTTPEGKVELRLVDFGEAVEGKPENQFAMTGGTPEYAPFEFFPVAPGPSINFAVCADDVDDRSPQAFDMFSASSILVELIVGLPPLDFLSDTEEWYNTDVDVISVFEALEVFTKNPEWLVKRSAPGHEVTSEAFRTEGTIFNKVLVKASEGLDKDPKARPTAEGMLAFIEPLRNSLGSRKFFGL